MTDVTNLLKCFAVQVYLVLISWISYIEIYRNMV